VQPPVECAVLVAAARKTDDRRTVDAHLQELAQLADTAGAVVVGQLTQRVDRPNPATFLGSGKVEELDALIRYTGATLVIFDDELSPAQGKNLEDAVNTRVVDRAELILDIFAIRARTAEARMQVELAQLEYTLPRLTRMWTHLEKFRGGIGVRGPGETQLETDRRLINKRIRLLKQRLEEVRKSREVQRAGRSHHFRAALVGYTNAGKSSVLRGLSGAAEVFVEDRLFATLDPLTREVNLEGRQILLTDTVGFIRKLPHHLVASFRATLEEVKEADLLLHVIDASSDEWESQMEVVDSVLADIGVADKPLIYVFNKTDRLDESEVAGLRQRLAGASGNGAGVFPGDSVLVSAAVPNGLDSLRRRLLDRIRQSQPVTEVRIPVADGRLIAQLHRDAEVLDQHAEGDELVMHARMDDNVAARLRRRGYVARPQ
jgi:GTP-binding protein HflX